MLRPLMKRSNMFVCGLCQENLVKDVVIKCYKILSLYTWLIDSYVLDFFTEDLWKKLPECWQDALHDIQPSEISLLLDPVKLPKYKKPWPLSLLALRSNIINLSIPRRNHCIHISHTNANDVGSPSSYVKNELRRACDGFSAGNDCIHGSVHCKHKIFNVNVDEYCNNAGEQLGQSKESKSFLRAFQKHVKPKKRHEIFQMAKVVCGISERLGVKRVVDIGSGLGHLARLLTYGHNIFSCCVESQPKLSEVARKLDEEMEYTLSKYLSEEEHKTLLRPCHITYNIRNGMDSSEFITLFSEAFLSEKSNVCNSNNDFGIVGLHPCGDLAAILMQIFISCPAARFICIAGCCYMKLTPNVGFPLSLNVLDVKKKNNNYMLSYEAREMACHAIESYSKNLLSENCSHLKIHCYRATLEWIIVKNWPHLRHSGLKSIKYNEELDFSKYASLALSPLGLIPPAEDLQDQKIVECLNLWLKVVSFYSLRLMLAPLVETLLLYDRLLYLSEQDIPCRIGPEFNPEISPRNHLLVGMKSPTCLINDEEKMSSNEKL